MMGSTIGLFPEFIKAGSLPPKKRLAMSVIIITSGLGMDLIIQEGARIYPALKGVASLS